MNLTIDNTSCEEIIFTQGGVSHSLDKLYYNEHLVWEKTYDEYEQQYLTIKTLEANNTITFAMHNVFTSLVTDVSYSTDGGTTWTTTTNDGSDISIVITLTDIGDEVLLKGNAISYYAGTSPHYYSNITSTKTFDVYGNIMSLLYNDSFIGKREFKPTNQNTYGMFRELFIGSYVANAENLRLPVTTFKYYVDENQYYVRQDAYNSMFKDCASLTKAPVLPALTAELGCYVNMFNGCSSLEKIICYATSIQTYAGYLATSTWVDGVAASGTFYKNSAMSSWTTGTSGIPSGWTVNDYAA